MPDANQQLRIARERAESPSCPGSAMTRQDLAEAINAHLYRVSEGARVTCVDANHIGKWERGVIRWPAAHYRAALRAVFRVRTDRELGFTRPSRTRPGGNVDRKQFLTTTLGVGAAAALPRLTDHHDMVGALAGPTAHYRLLEQAVPSHQLAPAVAAHLRLAHGMVDQRLNTSRGYAMLAEVAGLSAWLAADSEANDLARRRYLEAVQHAERARQPLLACYMIASLGQFATESGAARDGVALIDRAARQLDRSAPDSARAWLAALSAVAHSTLGDDTATHAALRAARTLADRHRGEPIWPWVFTFDQAKASRYEATALSRLGDLHAAEHAFAAAAPTLNAAKPHALALAERAQLLARRGDVERSCALATEALGIGRLYGSRRITTRVRHARAVMPNDALAVRALDMALAGRGDG